MSYVVLVLSASVVDSASLTQALEDSVGKSLSVEQITDLSQALQRIKAGGIAAIIADLSLPDSQGMATFDTLFAAAHSVPILTIAAVNEIELAKVAIERGAWGYLVKGDLNSYLVPQSVLNIIECKAGKETAFAEKTRAEVTLNSISDAVIGTNMSGDVDYLNLAAENITGWSREDARGHPIGEVMSLINGETREREQNPTELVLRHNKPMALAAGTILTRRDGREVIIEDSAAPIHDSNGQISGAVIVFHDVTAAKAMAMKMAYLAQHDFLTDLPNRVLLNDRILNAIAVAQRRGTGLAVLFLDLDHLKHINDSLGHEIGDKLLQSVGQRLLSCVRRCDTVCRQGGDEFIVLLSDCRHTGDAAVIAEKLIKCLADAHSIDGHQLNITVSIGISTYPADGKDPETLVKNADTAMYQAKKSGRNACRFFKTEMNIQAVERQTVEVHLRRALQRNEFALHYQPIVNLNTRRIVGAEALLRWNHPEWGLTFPGRFISVAEDCGAIVEIGRWVLKEACAQTKRWDASGYRLGSIAVNVSALEFRRKDFVESVRTILKNGGFDPSRLQFEITESALMHENKSGAATLKQLRNMKIQLAVDDFGTGYSSLSYLSKFPIDVLKVDQSFVRSIESEDKGAIVTAIIAMGNSLEHRVIAEGVETEAQLNFLRAGLCAEGQGYLFGGPIPAGEFVALMEGNLPRMLGSVPHPAHDAYSGVEGYVWRRIRRRRALSSKADGGL